MKRLKQVEIFSDGACSGNPGVGGWGAILRFQNIEKEMSGGLSETTNNQMELTAVIMPLEALKEPCEATIVTDSQYVANAFNKNWLERWQKNGWKTSKKEPVKNIELWQRLAALSKRHRLIFKWIKGHDGHSENERCDRLAVAAREKVAQNKT